MSITYESAHKQYRDARDEYDRLESLLAAARAKMNAAERECSVEWRKLLNEHITRVHGISGDGK
jgi:hypothetical protein